MKTILIPVSNSFFVRNFLRTSAMQTLAEEQDVKLILLVPTSKLEYYQEQFKYPFVVFDELPDMNTNLERFFRFLEVSSIHTRTVMMQQWWDLKRRGSRARFFIKLLSFLFGRVFWWLGQFAFWRNTIRVTYKTIPTNLFGTFFIKYKPDLVFCPTLLYGEIQLIKEAKCNRIRTLGMALSWDNFYSKTLLRARPDHLIVHTAMIRDQAVRLGDYDAKDISIAGIPQYDTYFKLERIMPRDEFIASLGGDASKPLVVYALSGKAGLDMELNVLDVLHQSIKSREIDKDIQVLVRPYPKYDFPQDKIDYFKSNYGFLVRSSVSHVGKGKHAWEFDEESLNFLANTLAHADVVINMYSTFFIEAAILGKPLIGVAFDGSKKNNYWNSAERFFDWDHLSDIKKLNGILLVKSREELAQAINKYLAEPSYLSNERRKIVEQQCQFTDGRSAERVVKVMLDCLHSLKPRN